MHEQPINIITRHSNQSHKNPTIQLSGFSIFLDAYHTDILEAIEGAKADEQELSIVQPKAVCISNTESLSPQKPNPFLTSYHCLIPRTVNGP